MIPEVELLIKSTKNVPDCPERQRILSFILVTTTHEIACCHESSPQPGWVCDDSFLRHLLNILPLAGIMCSGIKRFMRGFQALLPG